MKNFLYLLSVFKTKWNICQNEAVCFDLMLCGHIRKSGEDGCRGVLLRNNPWVLQCRRQEVEEPEFSCFRGQSAMSIWTPRSSIFSRILSGIPESVMIMSKSSMFPIFPKPLLPNLEESARMTVFDEAFIIAVVRRASSIVAQVTPVSRLIPSQPMKSLEQLTFTSPASV